MAVFVDLSDSDTSDPGKPSWPDAAYFARHSASTRVANDDAEANPDGDASNSHEETVERENPNRNPTTEALGCYPIIESIAGSIDLNTLDSLTRTCRQVHADVLQYRTTLIKSTLHCANEDLPVDPNETLRRRAQAINWFFTRAVSRTAYTGKASECARDLVGECRRCGKVVCRNCAIKPPASIVLRDRHRRLCVACQKAPLSCLAKPDLGPDVSLNSEFMQHSICNCESKFGVWLCQPCGRSIRVDDRDYKSTWQWRSHYGEDLGGLGTGIGDGDRGVICGRGSECLAARDCEQETDGDADDGREAETRSHVNSRAESSTSVQTMATSFDPSVAAASPAGGTSHVQSGPGNVGIAMQLPESSNRRVPSPALGPGYQRHEIEGIGGVVKIKRVRILKVGACVPEYEDEKVAECLLGREIKGQLRSWCGWCWRVVPGTRDLELAKTEAADVQCVGSRVKGKASAL